jgi:hypothetical protein
MKKFILTTTLVFAAFFSEFSAQDLISGGTNSWILHTPDDGRTSIHLAPKTNGNWDWTKETVFYNDGGVKFNGDITLNGSFTSSITIDYNNGNRQISLNRANGNAIGFLKINAANQFVFSNTSGGGDYNFETNIAGSGINSALFIEGANGYIGIGTTNPDSKLTVNGTIHSKEVLVDLNIPADYVFQKYYTGFSSLKETYQMPTLEEVEAFTKENHHLPNVPSASTIQKEGMQLSEMTNLLLQKIEELTLYTIEQEKRIKALEGKLKKKK